MNRGAILIAVAVIAAASTTAAAKTVDVSIASSAFSPKTVTIDKGDTVRWTNKDAIAHTATSTTLVFNSGTLTQNQTYSYTFSTAGTYPYFCTIHPSMTATVVVKDPAPPPPPVYEISGTITGPAATVASVMITGPKSVTVSTDAGGAYLAGELPAGSYTVRPSSSGHFYTPSSRNVTITTASLTGVDFDSAELPPTTYSIAGRVFGLDGAVATVEVIGPVSRTDTTDSDGDYDVRGLTPGTYEIRPSLDGFEFSPRTQTVTITSRSRIGLNFDGSAIPVDEVEIKKLSVKTKEGKTGKDKIAFKATLLPLEAHPFDPSAALTFEFDDYVLAIPAGAIQAKGRSGKKFQYKAGKTKVKFKLDLETGAVAIAVSAKKLTIGTLVDPLVPTEVRIQSGDIDATVVDE